MRSRLVLLALVVLAVALAAVPVPVGAQGPPATSQCEQRHVLLLMDQSASLDDTDPQDIRVDAATALVQALSPAAEDRTPVRLALAGFGSAFEPVGTFELPQDRNEALAAVGEFANRSEDSNTDYVLALQGAADYFAATDVPRECASLVWFTDGAHDVEQPTDGQASTYTSSTDPDTITGELSGQVCGPLPATSRLARPIRDEILDADFDILLSELRTSGGGARTDRLRANTDPVLAALFSPDSPCAISGGRRTVESASQLAEEFVAQAQAAIGATPIACDALREGVLRADLVRSVAFRMPANGPAAEIVIGHERIPASRGFTDVTVPASTRAAASRIVVEGGAELASCYAQFDAAVRLRETPPIYRDADRSLVELVVSGGEYEQPRSVGPELIDLAATASAGTEGAQFDEATGTWRLVIPRLEADEVQIEASAALASRLAPDGSNAEAQRLASTSASLDVADTPPAPSLVWVGSTSLEGSGTIQGELLATPQASVADAEFCLEIPGTAPILGSEGDAVGALVLAESTKCGPADVAQVVRFPAAIQIDRSTNSTATISIDPVVRFRDGTSEFVLNAAPTEVAQFTLTRPPDRLREALILGALVLLSFLVPLAVLWIANWWKGRLRDPSSHRCVVVPVEISTPRFGRGDTYDISVPDGTSLRVENRRPLVGSRKEWQLPGGMGIRRRLPVNPFGTPVARIVGGPALAGWPASPRSTHEMSSVRIDRLVIVRYDPESPPAPDPVKAEAVVVAPARIRPQELEGMLAEALKKCRSQLRFESAPRGRGPDRLDPPPPPPVDPGGNGGGRPSSPTQSGDSGTRPPSPPPPNRNRPTRPETSRPTTPRR